MKKILFLLFITSLFFTAVQVVGHASPVYACRDDDDNCIPPDPPPPSGPHPEDGQALKDIEACLSRPNPPCTLEEQEAIIESYYSHLPGMIKRVNPDGSIYYECSNGAYITIHGPHACGIPCGSNTDCSNVVSNCNYCVSGTCQPVTPTPIPPTNTPVPAACGQACNTKTDCSTAKPGCQDCVDKNDGKGKVCGQVACGVKCTTPADCQSAQDSCTACVAGQCKPVPKCGDDCAADPKSCLQNKEGCNSCLKNTTGSGPAMTCQPPAACGADCTKDTSICNTVKDVPGCTQCRLNQTNPGYAGQLTCQTPPACGTDCSKDASVCQQAGGGCTQCVAHGNGTKTCGTPITCGTDCSTDKGICKQASGGCNFCTHGKCTVDTFTPLMCKCDGMDTPPPFVSGQSITFTAYAKINGDDTDIASLKDMKFQIFEGTTPLATAETVNPVIISQTSDKTRYKATWTTTLPSNVKTGVTYQVVVSRDCQRQVEAFKFGGNSVAQGPSLLGINLAKGKGILETVARFVLDIVTGKSTIAYAQKQNLQLQTFHNAVNVQSSCSYTSWEFE